jgi:gingipain R
MLHGRRTTLLHLASLLLLLAAAPAAAGWVALTDHPAGTAPTVTVAPDGARAHEVTVTVAGLWLEATTRAGVQGSAVRVPGAVPLLQADHPELPRLARAVPLTPTGAVELTVLQQRWRRIAAAPPLPSPGPLTRAEDPARAPRRFGAVYDGGAVWPAAAVQLGRPFLVRDRRGVAVRIHPVRWDAASGELLVLEELRLRVATAERGGVNVVTAPLTRAPRAFAPVLRGLFGDLADAAGRDAGEKDGDLGGPGHGHGESDRLLIVTTDALRPAAGELASWKRRTGYDVETVTMSEIGGTSNGIHGAIQVRYLQDAGLAHCVLLGDAPDVPTNAGPYHGADSDGLYGLCSGDDLFVDVLVSRLPARTPAEAQLMIHRTIRYERDPQPDAAWYGAAVGIASDEGVPADWERAESLRGTLLASSYDRVERVYQGFGGSRASIADAVDAGASLVNYLGHGSGTSWLSVPFGNADVHALRNTDAWPWIIDVSCSNGDFSQPECFAEAWLRASDDGQPTGAVAMLSASTLTSWVPPCVMQETMVEQLAAGTTAELGALYAAGVAAVLVQYAGTSQGQKLMEQYNLFGDGSLLVRRQAPRPLAVAHAGRLDPGTGPVAVAAPAGARVVLTDAQSVVARAVADASGQATLQPRRALSAGQTLELTVTAADAVPYQATLTVDSSPVAADDTVPAVAARLDNWPNPFNPTTTVGFALPQAGTVRLSVHDARGRLVRVLADAPLAAGSHRVRWDGRDRRGQAAASGVYLVRLQTPQGQQVHKMTLAR